MARPATDFHGFPFPQPIANRTQSQPYPLQVFPPVLRDAIKEVQEFVQAPPAMVGSSALSVVSLASQTYVDVRRAQRLIGPVGLFMLTVASSGERKTTVDGFFCDAIRQWQESQAEAMKPLMIDYAADLSAWEAQRSGIRESIKQLAKSGKNTCDKRDELRMVEGQKPEPPRIPSLLLGDETPEKLAYRLAHEWPSAGVLSSEAAVVFGAHGMGKDSVMRHLGLLNMLWDGGSLSIGRRTTDSFEVKGARLTLGLQIQEETLLEFFDRSGALARGSGFLARFLLSWPESTQGTRRFREAPDTWPHLARFHDRITAILSQSPPMTESGQLVPIVMGMTPEARTEWIRFHDAIEAELAPGHELHEVRDVAAKIGDNAARVAALFHLFEHGVGTIGLQALTSACTLVAWHLNEALRFFGELALPPEMADAAKLDDFLIRECRATGKAIVNKRQARQYGPVRDGKRIDAAISELESLDRLQADKVGKRITLVINPELLR